jgi:hypothetical protein
MTTIQDPALPQQEIPVSPPIPFTAKFQTVALGEKGKQVHLLFGERPEDIRALVELSYIDPADNQERHLITNVRASKLGFTGDEKGSAGRSAQWAFFDSVSMAGAKLVGSGHMKDVVPEEKNPFSPKVCALSGLAESSFKGLATEFVIDTISVDHDGPS